MSDYISLEAASAVIEGEPKKLCPVGLWGRKFAADADKYDMLQEMLDKLEAILCKYLTEGPQYYPDDMVTDQPMWAICGEMIRENALKLLRDEIPHGIGIGIDKIKLREDGIHDVFATIYCERETHKGIIIGHGGRMLKRIGSEARRDIEWLFGTKVNLQLWVKVRPDWRNSASALKEFGFTPDF